MEGDRSGVLGTVRGGTRLGTDQLRVEPNDYRPRMVWAPELANASCHDHHHVLRLDPPLRTRRNRFGKSKLAGNGVSSGNAKIAPAYQQPGRITWIIISRLVA